jgi:hypothetical protein
MPSRNLIKIGEKKPSKFQKSSIKRKQWLSAVVFGSNRSAREKSDGKMNFDRLRITQKALTLTTIV